MAQVRCSRNSSTARAVLPLPSQRSMPPSWTPAPFAPSRPSASGSRRSTRLRSRTPSPSLTPHGGHPGQGRQHHPRAHHHRVKSHLGSGRRGPRPVVDRLDAGTVSRFGLSDRVRTGRTDMHAHVQVVPRRARVLLRASLGVSRCSLLRSTHRHPLDSGRGVLRWFSACNHGDRFRARPTSFVHTLCKDHLIP